MTVRPMPHLDHLGSQTLDCEFVGGSDCDRDNEHPHYVRSRFNLGHLALAPHT